MRPYGLMPSKDAGRKPEYRVFNPKNGDLLKKVFRTPEAAETRIDEIKKRGKYAGAANLVVKEW